MSLFLRSVFLACATASSGIADAPSGGVSVLPPHPLAAVQLEGDNAIASSTFGPAHPPDAAYPDAVQIEVRQRPPHPWNIQLHLPNAASIKRGDVLYATFALRCVGSATGEATSTFIFEQNGGDYSKSIVFPLSVGTTWKTFSVPFTSGADFPPAGAHACLQFGFDPETVQLGSLSVEDFGSSKKLEDFPSSLSAVKYAGEEADAPWRKEAAARIDRIRKADLTVLVTDKNGKPIPHASVTVTMKRHEFQFGTAVSPDWIMGRSAGPESTDPETYRETIKRLFNSVVIENGLKYQPWNDPQERAVTLQAIDWIRGQGLMLRGHNLVWPGWNYSPDDLKALAHDPAALRARLDAHIRDITGALRGKVVDWDVLNEPYTEHDFMDLLGNAEMVHWFQLAGLGDPTAKLYVNDFSILTGGGEDKAHQAGYEKVIRYLIDQGAPLDGIGFQGHFGWDLTAPEKVRDILEHYAAFGKRLKVTEFDVDMTDEQLQAQYLRDFMTMVFSCPEVDGFYMWGFWETAHWRPNAALFRKDWTLKPNGKAYMDLVLNKWWTTASGESDDAGRYRVRGFRGAYEIKTTVGQVTQTREVVLPKEGATIVVASP